MSIKFILLIHVKIPTMIYEQDKWLALMIYTWNSIYMYPSYLNIYEQLKFHAQLCWVWKMFLNIGACFRGFWFGKTQPSLLSYRD